MSDTKSEEQPAKAVPKNRIQSYHQNDVWANVFAFKRKTSPGETYRITIAKSYKSGERWKSSAFFGEEDTETVVSLMQQCRDYIRMLRRAKAEPLPDQAE